MHKFEGSSDGAAFFCELSSKEKIVLLLLIALHLSLNVPLLSWCTVDLDEPFSIFHSQHSLSELFGLFGHENNPPLHFVLLHYWIKLFGTGVAAVRSLSLLFSLFTVPVLYQTGRRFINRTGAVLLPALFIVSDFHHYHALEARPYSLLVLEFSLLFCLILKILLEGGTRKSFLLLGLLNALLFYTHYISLYFFPAEAIVFLVFCRQEQLRRLVLAAASFAVCVLPWIPVFRTRLKSVSSGGTWVPKPQVSELYGFINKFFNDKWALMALVLALALLFLLNGRKIRFAFSSQKKKLTIALLLFGIAYTGAFAASLKLSSVFLDRYLFFLTIPLFFSAALLFSAFRYGKLCFAGFFAVYLVRFDLLPENNRNSAQIAAEARALNAEKILIAPNYYDLAFIYHYDRHIFNAQTEQAFRLQERNAGIVPLISATSDVDRGKPKTLLLITGNDGAALRSELELQLKKSYRADSRKHYAGGYESVFFTRR